MEHVNFHFKTLKPLPSNRRSTTSDFALRKVKQTIEQKEFYIMEIATYRKKAREIEGQLLNKLAERGQGTLAKVLDLDEAAVSRMKRPLGKQKYSFFQMMSMALAYLDVVSPESEVAKSLLRIERLLTKEKAPKSDELFEA